MFYLLCTLLLALLVLAAPLACTNRVIPPTDVKDPVDVVLLDHGKHASLVLPGAERGMVRYSWGDWSWYALGQQNAASGVRALLLSSPATLGRRQIDHPVTPGTIGQAFGDPAEAQWWIAVERQAADDLRQGLDQTFARHQDTTVDNAAFGLSFVKLDDNYTCFHNSNHVTAQWLEELGCQVHGPAFGSTWQVEGVSELTGSAPP